MRIRSATRDDINTLSALCGDVQRIHAEAHPNLFKPVSDPLQFCGFFEFVFDQDNAHIFIVEDDDDKALGYVYAEYRDRSESLFHIAEKRIHIDQISVKPDYQRQGIGDMLMQAVKDLAQEKDAKRVTLGTWDFNTQAHGFFKKHGFEFQTFNMSCSL